MWPHQLCDCIYYFLLRTQQAQVPLKWFELHQNKSKLSLNLSAWYKQDYNKDVMSKTWAFQDFHIFQEACLFSPLEH